MAAPLLTAGTVVNCTHMGMATAAKPSTRVKIAGQPVVLQMPPLSVAGCPAQLPSAGGPVPAPCTMINFSTATMRVKVESTPVLTESSSGQCIGPQGALPTIMPGQQRVKGT